MSGRELMIQVWTDKHELRKDQYQWIVKHPHTCRNANRGGSTYARFTYLRQEANMLGELAACGIRLATASGPTVAGAVDAP